MVPTTRTSRTASKSKAVRPIYLLTGAQPLTKQGCIEILIERAHKIKRAVNESLKTVAPACARACAQAVTEHAEETLTPLLTRIAQTLSTVNRWTETII